MLQVNKDEQELLIYGEIGPARWGLLDASAVNDVLKIFKGKHVMVRINTPGGSVDEGVNIYNMIKRHTGGATTVVDSLAASMGSYLMMAGERRLIYSNSAIMIHEPWTITGGNSRQLRKDADVLDQYTLRMIPDYAARSGKKDDEIRSIMEEETYYTGQAIIDAGFADELLSDDAIARDARPDIEGLKFYANKPEKIPQSLLDAAKLRVAQLRRPPMTVEEAKMRAAAIT